jgi:dGTP triphosphohydrolase
MEKKISLEDLLARYRLTPDDSTVADEIISFIARRGISKKLNELQEKAKAFDDKNLEIERILNEWKDSVLSYITEEFSDYDEDDMEGRLNKDYISGMLDSYFHSEVQDAFRGNPSYLERMFDHYVRERINFSELIEELTILYTRAI